MQIQAHNQSSLVTVTKNGEELEIIRPGQHVLLSKIPQLTIQNINDPIQRAKKWYCRMGYPSRDEMKTRVSKQAENKYYDITVQDVDLLPWNGAGKRLSFQEPGCRLEEDEDQPLKRVELPCNEFKKEDAPPEQEPQEAAPPQKKPQEEEPQKEEPQEEKPQEEEPQEEEAQEEEPREEMPQYDKEGIPERQQSSSAIPKPGESLTVDPLGSLKVKSFDMVYNRGGVINEGAFGVIYEAYHVMNKPENTVAVKVLPRTSDAEDRAVVDEASLLRDIRHLPNATKIIDFYIDVENLYIVQELARGGDLFDRLIERERYTEEDARMLTKSLLMTIESLHKLNLVHLDLKPENILLKDANDDTDILLCDFGYAAYLPEDGSGLWNCCGTPAFVAPEIVNGVEYQEEVDMWSIGCILFMLLCGRQPFEGDTAELYQYISAADYGFEDPIWNVVSDEAKNLISSLLTLDKKERFSARQALESDWFSTCAKAKLNNNDLTSSLVGIRNYCETVRPELKHKIQHEELQLMRSLSTFRADLNVLVPSSDDISQNDTSDSVVPSLDDTSQNDTSDSSDSESMESTNESKSGSKTDDEPKIKGDTWNHGHNNDCDTKKRTSANLAKERFEKAYESFRLKRKGTQQQVEQLDDKQIEQRRQSELKMEQLRKRLSKLKQKQ